MSTNINTPKSTRPRTVHAVGTVRDQEETLYVCPNNCRSHMNLLYITNTGGASTDVTVEWYRNDGTTLHILGSRNINDADFIQWSGAYLVFEPGEECRFTPTGNNNPHVDVLATVEEFFVPIG
jgi:hypothetical protein